MRVIIAGSRGFDNYEKFSEVLLKTISIKNIDVTRVVSGGASGVDTMAIRWAQVYDIPCDIYPAAWNDITTPPVKIAKNKYGKPYNKLAGFNRNVRMANNADALIAFWDGKSPGTKHMIDTATEKGLIWVVIKVSVTLVKIGE